jgi:hypothetical protein
MPTSFTGLVLFVVLLLPGFAFLLTYRRTRPGQRLTALEETGAVVAASIVFDLALLGVFALIRTLLPGITPDVGELVKDASRYLETGYDVTILWSVGLLAGATGAAAWIGQAAGRRVQVKPSVMSSWWLLFSHFNPGARVNVGCVLDDGSYVSGLLEDWSKVADETADRDLNLTTGQGIPLMYQGKDHAEPRIVNASTISVSARKIVSMFVSYLPANPTQPKELPAQPEPDSSAAT